MSGKNRPTNWPEDWSEDQIRAAEALEAVPSDPDWLDGIEDAGLPPIHPSQLDPLPNLDEPLLSRWIAEHVRELVVAQEAELTGPYGAAWRRFERLLHEVARLDNERTKLTGDARDKVARQWKEEQQDLEAFRRSSEFQAALRYRLDRMQPIFERIEALPGNDPEQAMMREQARTRRHQMEVLLVHQVVTGEKNHCMNAPTDRTEAVLDQTTDDDGGQHAEQPLSETPPWVPTTGIKAAFCEIWPGDIDAAFNKPRPWLLEHRRIPGKRGKGGDAFWDPIGVAAALKDGDPAGQRKRVIEKKLSAAFLDPALKLWRDAWTRHLEEDRLL